MREILFRGKRMDNGRWICGGYFTADSRHFICNEDATAQVDPETVGEFTGLVDKNGVKIFEGDFVDTRTVVMYKRMEISYFDGAFWVGTQDWSFHTRLQHYKALQDGFAEVEVVGNIYENGHS